MHSYKPKGFKGIFPLQILSYRIPTKILQTKGGICKDLKRGSQHLVADILLIILHILAVLLFLEIGVSRIAVSPSLY